MLKASYGAAGTWGPLLDELRRWLTATMQRVSAKSELAGAIKYALVRWTALIRYRDDGCIEIDNNSAERSIRSVVLGRRNYLFAESDAGGERAANIHSLIGTALLNARDPYLCLRHVLERVAEHPITHRHAAALEVCTGSARRAAASLSVATARKTPFNAVKADAPLYQSRIELRDLEPAIWRQILLPASVKLPKLHVALLWTIGWAGGHLHEFVIGRRHFGEPNPDFDSGPPVQSEDRFTLTAALGVSKSFTYLYDFGDGWQHHVVVEKILSSDLALKLPVCLGGANACRPEDVGAPPGYVDFLQAINDPAHEEHDNISNGAADRSTPNFRLDHINTFLHQATPFFTRSNSNRQCGLRMTLT